MNFLILPIFILNYFLLLSTTSLASAENLEPFSMPITHCYHWLDENILMKYKIPYALKNYGELDFFSSNDSTNEAGDGLYCAQSPIGSVNYGNRVIRIDFVDDTVFYDKESKKTYCGLKNPNSYLETSCQNKQPDVVYYNSTMGWFAIKNPKVVKQWTVQSQQLLNDLIEVKNETSDIEKGHYNYEVNKLQSGLDSAEGIIVFKNFRARTSLSKEQEKFWQEYKSTLPISLQAPEFYP